jgi:peroxiredoxin 1
MVCRIIFSFKYLVFIRLSIPRKEAGIHGLQIPLIADKSMSITKQYGILDEEEGFAYRFVILIQKIYIIFIDRATFIIDDKGILRQLSINDRPVGRDITETRRLIQALQYADKIRESTPKLGFLEGNTKQISINANI